MLSMWIFVFVCQEVVIGLVFFYGNYFYTIFRKFSLLTKFCIKAIATTIKIMLSSTFSSHSLLSAGRQAIHDGPAFPGVITISPGRQAISHCSDVQILSQTLLPLSQNSNRNTVYPDLTFYVQQLNWLMQLSSSWYLRRFQISSLKQTPPSFP